MRFGPLPLLAGCAAILAGIVAAELAEAPARQAPAPPPVAAAGAPPKASVAADTTQADVAALLDRPPFSPDRRPAAGEGTMADRGLPHLTGILVSGDKHWAIFAAPEAGRNTVVREGEQVGAYRVQAISSASVTLTGPGGSHTVQPRFSAAPLPGPVPGFQLPPPAVAMQYPAMPAGLAVNRNVSAAAASPVPPPSPGVPQ